MSVQEEIAAFDALEGDYFSLSSYEEGLTATEALEVLAQDADGHEDVVIYVWKKKVVDETWKDFAVQELADRLLELFDEDGFGPVDEATELGKEAAAEVDAKARELVDLFVSKAHVWRCDQTAECRLSAEAVRAIFKRAGI